MANLNELGFENFQKISKPRSGREARSSKSFPKSSKQRMARFLTFVLVQQARSQGGDKFECLQIPGFVVYFPQTVSRLPNGTVLQQISITLHAPTHRLPQFGVPVAREIENDVVLDVPVALAIEDIN